MLHYWVPGNWASPKTYTGTILALDFSTVTCWKPQHAFQSGGLKRKQTCFQIGVALGGNQRQGRRHSVLESQSNKALAQKIFCFSSIQLFALHVDVEVATWSNWFRLRLSHSSSVPSPDAASEPTPQPGRASRTCKGKSLGEWWCDLVYWIVLVRFFLCSVHYFIN